MSIKKVLHNIYSVLALSTCSLINLSVLIGLIFNASLGGECQDSLHLERSCKESRGVPSIAPSVKEPLLGLCIRPLPNWFTLLRQNMGTIPVTFNQSRSIFTVFLLNVLCILPPPLFPLPSSNFRFSPPIFWTLCLYCWFSCPLSLALLLTSNI